MNFKSSEQIKREIRRDIKKGARLEAQRKEAGLRRASQRDARERARLSSLIGATITRVSIETFMEEPITVIHLRTLAGTETTLAALQDAEGNGPGWLDYDPEGKTASTIYTDPAACDGPCSEDDPCPKHCGRSVAGL
jgi:hypothetical protein